MVVVSDFNKHFGGSMDLAKKKAQISGFAYPYSPPSCTYKFIIYCSCVVGLLVKFYLITQSQVPCAHWSVEGLTLGKDYCFDSTLASLVKLEEK